ncbi:hypothetical protein POM88_048332 [Heracleum sosnowskyi]|uniref:Uncharacterized protein n=1 Tax=Heracleum sosnowskyi TaxID=360622 RepID=A0AAD8GW04_9APIA|nr:hypothetical protein POM88_048332 [Heracleum sosnowskyi]
MYTSVSYGNTKIKKKEGTKSRATMPLSEQGTFYQQVHQPQEYENWQDTEHIRPKNRSNVFFNAVGEREYRYQQGIEHIQPGVKSLSSQMRQAHQIVNPYSSAIHARIRSSAHSRLVQAHEYENQQGIEYIQTGMRSMTSPQMPQTLGYENQQGIEYIQGRMKSTTYFKLPHAHEFEAPQQIDYIQPKQRSIVISEVNQQAWKDEYRKALDYVFAKEKSKREASGHENQQDTEDIYLIKILTMFAELGFTPRSPKSCEYFNF